MTPEGAPRWCRGQPGQRPHGAILLQNCPAAPEGNCIYRLVRNCSGFIFFELEQKRFHLRSDKQGPLLTHLAATKPRKRRSTVELGGIASRA